MERTDGLVRTLRNFYILSFEKDVNDNKGYQPLLSCFTSLSEGAIEFMATQGGTMLNYLITETGNSNSVKVLLGKARENARGSQDKVTKELWEQINSMYHYINQPCLIEKLNGPDALDVIEHLHTQTLLYNGVVDSTMPRGQGWNFMNTGKYMERSLQTLHLTEWYLNQIDYKLDGGDTHYWRHLLLSLSGYEFYLKNLRDNQHTRRVIDQVIFNEDFTRSVFYGLVRMGNYIKNVTAGTPTKEALALRKQFNRLKSMVEFTDTPSLTSEQMQTLVKEIRHQLWDFHSSFSKVFFNYG
jgi:uncharacterized alpha-E superfamily protein